MQLHLNFFSSRPRVTIAVLLFVLAAPQAWAEEGPSCLDASNKPYTYTKECSMQLIPLMEAKTESEFHRLAEKFNENKPMLEMLQKMKLSWSDYRNSQCTLESMAATGPQQGSAGGMSPTLKPLSPEANKAYMKCVMRTFEEMKASLSKF